MSKDLSQYVTTARAAELLGTQQEHIRKLLSAGKVKGIKLGHDWLVYVPSIQHHLETKSARGRPASGQPVLKVNE